MFAIPKKSPYQRYSKKYKYESIHPVNDMDIAGSKLVPDLSGQHYLGYISAQHQQNTVYKNHQSFLNCMIYNGGGSVSQK
jgi:hypothetical protein